MHMSAQSHINPGGSESPATLEGTNAPTYITHPTPHLRTALSSACLSRTTNTHLHSSASTHLVSFSIAFGTGFLALSQSGLLSLLSQVSTWTLIATLPITLAHIMQTLGPITHLIAPHIILLIILPTIVAFTLFPQSIVTWLSAQPLRITPHRHIHPAWLILLLLTFWAWLDY